MVRRKGENPGSFVDQLNSKKENHYEDNGQDQVIAPSKQCFMDAMKLKMISTVRDQRKKSFLLSLDDDILLGHDIEDVLAYCVELGVSVAYRFGVDRKLLFAFGPWD